MRGAVAAERDAQARAGAASPDATAWPSSEQCVPQCPSGPSCSCLYWAWNADIRVYTEVGGLLEVWEPLAPRWAPRMHVRTNHYEIGTILTQFSHGGSLGWERAARWAAACCGWSCACLMVCGGRAARPTGSSAAQGAGMRSALHVRLCARLACMFPCDEGRA